MHLYYFRSLGQWSLTSFPPSTFSHHRMLTSHPKKPLNDTMCFTCPIHCFMFWWECSKFQPIFRFFVHYLCSSIVREFSSAPSVLPVSLLFDSISELGNNVASLRCVFCIFVLSFMLSTFRFFVCLCFPPVHHFAT